jgi:hypothetical protein
MDRWGERERMNYVLIDYHLLCGCYYCNFELLTTNSMQSSNDFNKCEWVEKKENPQFACSRKGQKARKKIKIVIR